VNFTDTNGNTAIDRFTVSSNPDVANRQSGFRVPDHQPALRQPQRRRHRLRAGQLPLHRDGRRRSGRRPGQPCPESQLLLGKILRIDVNHRTSTRNYVAGHEPYVGKTGLDEIWALGLRSPWRWSFDQANGSLWIGDVGRIATRWIAPSSAARHRLDGA
jgi:hypothetical protein